MALTSVPGESSGDASASYQFPLSRSGWPLKGPECAKAVAKNPEVVIPSQCDAQFEIEAGVNTFPKICVLRRKDWGSRLTLP